MNNPIEINALRHFLEINSVRTEILEPIGFDASNFVVEQKSKGYARDIYYGNSEASLEFHYEYGVNELPSGLELILEQENLKGSEALVNYVLKKGDIDFTIGQLDFASAETDYKSYFKCSVIQNNDKSIIKKREKIKVDLFATKDLDENTITPIDTTRFLLRAKPVDKISLWQNGEYNDTTGSINTFIFPAMQLTKFYITKSFVPFERIYIYGGGSAEVKLYNQRCIEASNRLTNIKVSIKIKGTLIYDNIGSSASLGTRLLLGAVKGDKTYLNNSPTPFFTSDPPLLECNTITPIPSIDSTIDFNVDVLEQGESMTVYLLLLKRNISDTSTYTINIEECEMNITATETGIDTVIEAVRYIDLIKQTFKTAGGYSVIAPKFDAGGQFYDNFCFNGKLIRQLITEPFYNTISDVEDSLMEFNADYEIINNSNIYIGQYTDFYKDNNMGSYPMLPDATAKFTKNERYLINKFTFGYEKFEQDRDEDGTIDAIHTESEWYMPNNNSINEKEVKCNYTRDPFAIESVRRRATEKKSTANNSDDDIFIVDGIALEEGAQNGLSGLFNVQISDTQNTFKILANDNFRWDLLGFEVGDTINITYNSVGYTTTVLEIEPAILTLQWLYAIDFSGETFLNIDYPLSNVQYVIRTSEGLAYSENILNPYKYANMRYSIKRNMSYWFNYLATAGKFIPTKQISNSYFKSNGKAIIKFDTEPTNIAENASIPIVDISNFKILSQNIYETTIVIEFEDMVTLMGKIQTQRGYIEINDHDNNLVKGYIVKLDHKWATNECKITLEIKNE